MQCSLVFFWWLQLSAYLHPGLSTFNLHPTHMALYLTLLWPCQLILPQLSPLPLPPRTRRYEGMILEGALPLLHNPDLRPRTIVFEMNTLLANNLGGCWCWWWWRDGACTSIFSFSFITALDRPTYPSTTPPPAYPSALTPFHSPTHPQATASSSV